MEKSKLNSIIKRTLTALVLVPITLLALYMGFPYVEIIALIFGGMLAWEWSNMVPNSRMSFYSGLYTLSMTAAVLMTSWLGIFFVILGATLLACYKAKDEARRNLLILGVPYISVGIGSIVWLYDLVGPVVTLWFLVVVWCVDIGGYVVGCSLKGPKLAPKISPNKTWSGLVGGILFSDIASIIFCYFYGILEHMVFYVICASVIALIAQVGDLLESHIKRILGIKDSSDLIPGHGGAFDRIDGLIFAAPIVFLFFMYSFWLM